ncbi:MAG: tRNA threonylcarbamoyladenosine dehydratase, partial [Clostridia bacterium]|nr:tRNA threonylcarbamoyladenosine dehydratase [Clostridia bacterium]
MEDMFSRTRMLLGDAAMDRLKAARVAVFGIGGVGGHAVEALARSGVGALDLVDSDRVALSNLNRQIIATRDTLGMLKVEAAKARVLSINPDCAVETWPVFFLPETADRFDFTQYDYVIDAIDTVAGKLRLIEAAKAAGVPVISSMGAGNKLDATAFRVADISETSVCPLARIMRRELKKRGIDHVKVVFSTEPAL